MEDSYLVCSCVGDIEDTLAKTGHCFLILGFLPTYSTSWIFYKIFIIKVRPTFTYINNGNGSRVFFGHVSLRYHTFTLVVSLRN